MIDYFETAVKKTNLTNVFCGCTQPKCNWSAL